MSVKGIAGILLLLGIASASGYNGNLTLNISHGSTLDLTTNGTVVNGTWFFIFNFTPSAGTAYNFSYAIDGVWRVFPDTGTVFHAFGAYSISGNGTSTGGGNLSGSGSFPFLARWSSNTTNTTLNASHFYEYSSIYAGFSNQMIFNNGTWGFGNGVNGIATGSCIIEPDGTMVENGEGTQYDIIERDLNGASWNDGTNFIIPPFDFTWNGYILRALDDGGATAYLNIIIPHGAMSGRAYKIVLSYTQPNNACAPNIRVSHREAVRSCNGFDGWEELTGEPLCSDTPDIRSRMLYNPGHVTVSMDDLVQLMVYRLRDDCHDDPIVYAVGILYEKNMIGSRTEFTK